MPAIRLPDGRIIQNVPEGTTKAQLTEKLIRNGVIKGDEDWVKTTPANENTESQPSPSNPASQEPKEQSLLDKVAGKGSVLEKIGQFGMEPQRKIVEATLEFGPGLGEYGAGAFQAGAELAGREDIAQKVGEQVEKEREGLSDWQKGGREIGKAIGTAPIGGKNLLTAATAAGGTMGLLEPTKENNEDNSYLDPLLNRVENAATGAATGILTAGGLKLAQKVVPALALKGLAATGNEWAAKKMAINKLKKGLTREGQDAGTLLDEVNKEGVDLIDKVDPRFSTSAQALKALNNPETIKIADESLKRISSNADKLQGELMNLVSQNKISPEKAGEILGRNSKKLFDQSIAARRAKAAPLYKSGLSSGTKIPLDTKLSGADSNLQELGIDKDNLTLGNLLKSPVVQNTINSARTKSAEFANSPSEKIYGKIYEKVKPEAKQSPLGFIYPESKTASAKFKIPDNDVRVLHAVDTILYDKIKGIGLQGATKEQAALSGVRSEISRLLDNANPDLAKARQIWKIDSQDLQSNKNSLIGKYAKYYTEGRKDELTKAAMDVLKMQPNRLALARKTNPQEFNDLLRSSLENKIANITPVDDGPINPKAFSKALFGQNNGKQLEVALNDKELFQGYKKLADVLDTKFQRNRIAKSAMESSARGSKIMTGKTAAINRGMEFIEDRILTNPAAQKQFVNYMFTDAGKDALKQIAKTQNSKIRDKLVDSLIMSSALTAANQVTKEEE